jgi:hypothetical protein
MAEQKTATKKTAKRSGETPGTFTDEEKAAAKERVKEMRRSPRASKADGEHDVLEKISEMDDADRVMAERIHAIVTASAPDLAPRTWYGMPAYAKDGRAAGLRRHGAGRRGPTRSLALRRGCAAGWRRPGHAHRGHRRWGR